MHIFISYSSKNRDLIKTLAADLKALGHDVWFDVELTGGQLWWDNILEQIRACDLLVAALTPQSMLSEPCRLERDYAHALNKRILPVMVADGVRVNLLPPELSLLHFVDYRNPDDKMTAIALSRALDNLPDARLLPDTLPAAPPPPINSLSELAHKVSARALDFQEQTAALIELKGLLEDDDLRADALELLRILRKRPDLLAAVANEIDAVLGSPVPSGENPQTVAESTSGEDVLKEIGATLHTATVNYTGKMAITKQRLVFQGEYLTKSQRLEIPMADIQDVKKGLALLSASPTIVVRTRDGKEHSFSIQAFGGLLYGNREEIINLIQGMISQ